MEESPEMLFEKGKIYLPDNGIECWPGEILKLDTEQIFYGGKLVDMDLYAWYGKKNKKANCFIIDFVGGSFYVTDYYFKASSVWNYLMQKYKAE